MSPLGSDLRKLNTCAQLQAFPYPTASKSLVCSNAFMVKCGAQSVMFNSVTDKEIDRQTDRQIDRQKFSVFGSPSGG